MSEPTTDAPLPDATGEGQTGDDVLDLTAQDTPPVAEGEGGPEEDAGRPDPCTAMGGQ